MPPKSSVYDLPDHVRAQLDKLIGEGRLSLDALVEFLKTHEDVDNPPSRSAIGRYAPTIRETSAFLRETRAAAEALVEELGLNSESEQGRLMVEMLRGLIFKTMQDRTSNPEAKIDIKEIKDLARALKDLSHAMQMEQEFAKKLKEEARREVEAEVRAKIDKLGSVKDLKKLSDEELEKKIAELAAQS